MHAADFRETGVAGGCSGKVHTPTDRPRAKPKRDLSARPAGSASASGGDPASTRPARSARPLRRRGQPSELINPEDFPELPIHADWIPNQRINGLPVYGPKGEDVYPACIPDPHGRGPYRIGSRPVPPRRVYPACWWCGRTDHHHRHCSKNMPSYKRNVRERQATAADREGYRQWLRDLAIENERLWAQMRIEREARQRLAAEAAAEVAAVGAEAAAEEAREDEGAAEEEWEAPSGRTMGECGRGGAVRGDLEIRFVSCGSGVAPAIACTLSVHLACMSGVWWLLVWYHLKSASLKNSGFPLR